jgi:hypothetical protein
MDALIAEKVMGWHLDEDGSSAQQPDGTGGDGYCRRLGPGSGDFSPSTNIASAWEVVEKLTAIPRPYFEVTTAGAYSERPGFLAAFDLDRPMKRVTATAETAPHAICLAALRAVGVVVA